MSDANVISTIEPEFYYIVFQSNPSKDIVKTWIDGNEYSRTFSLKDFLGLVEAHEDPNDVSYYKRACLTYAFFFWDVVGHRLKMIHASIAEDVINLRDKLNNSPNEQKEERKLVGDINSDLSERYWKAELREDALNIAGLKDS